MKSSRDRILDAAEVVVLRDGAAHLTLDAVAAEVQMSKGGVLYHFPSKDELIRGMIKRLAEQFEAEVSRLAAEDPHPTGRKLRAMLNASFPSSRSEQHTRTELVSGGLLAAVATNPVLLDDYKDHSARMEHDILNDGIDPVSAMVIHMAADGIWLSGLFGIPHPSGELRSKVIARLLEMTTGPAQAAPAAEEA